MADVGGDRARDATARRPDRSDRSVRTGGPIAVLVASLALLVLVACGPGDGDDLEAAVGDGGWVLDRLPDGFVPAVVDDLEGQHLIVYQHESDPDLLDGPLRLATTLAGPGPEGIPGADPVTIHGETGYLFPLWDDGVRYGTAVMWPDGQDRWVTLSWAATVVDDDVLAVAADARPASEDEWARLDRVLGTAAVVVGDTGDAVDSTEELVVEATTADGTPYRLVALVPTDYPLSDIDRRVACYRLDVADQPGDHRCDGHPWWVRFGGSTLVYGTAASTTAEVAVAELSIDGEAVDDTPVVDAVHRTASPAPVVFYLVEVPGWCWVEVTATDGTDDPRLGPIGPLPADEHHAECLAGPVPPTTVGP